MQKILTLGTKDWITGVGVGQHLEGTGLFTVADGINPFVDPFLNSAGFGLLQTGKTAVDASGAVVDETIIAFIPRDGSEMYALSTSGDIYSIALATDVPTLKKATTATSCYGGFFSKGGGTEYFYYFNGTQIGRYDLTTGATNNYWTGLFGTIRPVHYWQKMFWYGVGSNGATGSNVGKLDPAALPSTGALTGNALGALSAPFDPEYTVMCINNDDYRLVIGVASQISSIIHKGQTKVYFWDGASSLPEKVWDIPEPTIQNLTRIGDFFYAVCGRSLYAFNYATSPKKLIDLDSNHSTAIGNFNSIDRIGDAVLWGGGGLYLSMYGKINSHVPNAYSTPFALPSTANPISVNSSAKPGTIYVGGNNAKLYTISTITGGDSNGFLARTHFIDLKDVYNIQGITVIFGLNLASGDSVDVKIVNRNGDSQTTSAIFSTHGAVSRIHFPVALKADQVYVEVTFNGGNPKIKDIILYGEKTLEL